MKSSYSIYLKKLTPVKVALGASVALLGFAGTANAAGLTRPFPISNEEINQYLMTGTGNGANQDAINLQNIEFGANTKKKAGDPTDIKDSNNVISDDDPNNVGVFEKRWDEEKGILTSDQDENPLPFTNAPLFAGIDNSGTAAVTSKTGKFSYSNSTAYTDTDFAIRCASNNGTATGECQNNDSSNSRWRTSDGIQSGVINSNTIDQYKDKISTNGFIDDGAGVVGEYDHDNLIKELEDAWTYVDGLDNKVDYTIDYKAEDFKDGYSLFDIDSKDTDGDGFAIIDINAGDDNFDINNFDWVLDGDGSTFAIFRIRGNSNMLMSNSSITLGTGGIGNGSPDNPINSLGAIFVHYEEPTGNTDQVFDFDNVILNGVGFWDLNAFRGGNYDDTVQTELNIQNGQGCSQFISSKHDFDNGRYNLCAAAAYEKMTHEPTKRVPEPGSVIALAFIGGGIFLTRRRQNG
ncbi:MAG: PEP-CTERM sorting domain-containing protein [Trichodesmium sp.]